MTPRSTIIAGFAALLALVIATDLFARRTTSGVRPLPVTLAAAMRFPVVRILVLGFWLWLGWHFLAR